MAWFRKLLNQWASLGRPKASAAQASRVFDARRAALEAVLGPADEGGYFPRPPFQFGGEASVLAFTHFLTGGVVFVTADLTGFPGVIDQPGEYFDGYELAICQPTEEVGNPLSGQWLVSRFARHTLNEPFAPGHTSDIRAQDGPPVDGLIFTTLGDNAASFMFDGRRYGILLAVGVKTSELVFAYREGPAALLARLSQAGVLPWTRVRREPVA